MTPLAPERIAEVSARFIARRKATRFCSCSAIDWATSLASSSGRLTSRMFTFTGLAGQLVQLLAQRVDFAARLADHDAGAGRVDVDRDLAAALDRDVREPRVGKLAVDVIADLQVFLEDVGEVFAP